MTPAQEELILGVPPVDSLIPPAPEGSTILYLNDPGTEAEPFLYQAAHAHLSKGHDVIYAVVARSPSSVVAEMGAFGFDAHAHEGQLHMVDAFSPMLGTSEDAEYTVDDPTDLQQLATVLKRAVEEHPDAVVIMDSLSALIDRTSPEAVAQAFPDIHEALASASIAMVLFTHWPYAAGMEDFFDRFDALIRFGGMEDRVLFGQYFQLDRVPWAPNGLSRERHLYKLQRPGGVFVYIPKIVVTGPYNSGKSTFVQTVSDKAVRVDRLGTTVALDHGHVTVQNITADIFGTPGQVRFDPILRTVAGQALGVIVLVDATKPASFSRARELLEKTWDKGLPAIVVANKQDLPNALSPKEVRERLDVDRSIQVLGCVGTEREQALEVLDAMTSRILSGRVEA